MDKIEALIKDIAETNTVPEVILRAWIKYAKAGSQCAVDNLHGAAMATNGDTSDLLKELREKARELVRAKMFSNY